MYPVMEQFKFFAAAMAAGMAGGMLFDGYRTWRWAARPGRMVTLAADALFWLFGTGAFFALLFYLNGGEMRFYVLVALVSGLAIYMRCFSQAALRRWRSLLRVFLRARRLLALFFWPWRVLALLLGRPLRLISYVLWQMGRLVFRFRPPT